MRSEVLLTTYSQRSEENAPLPRGVVHYQNSPQSQRGPAGRIAGSGVDGRKAAAQKRPSAKRSRPTHASRSTAASAWNDVAAAMKILRAHPKDCSSWKEGTARSAAASS